LSAATTLTAATRTVVVGRPRDGLTGFEDDADERQRLLVIVGAAVDDAGAEPDWSSVATRTDEVLAEIHTVLREFVAAEGALLADQRIVVLADESAVLGDPDRPGESIVACAVVALVRTLAMELRRRGSCVNLVLGDTIHRPGAPDAPNEDLLTTVDALLSCSRDMTGQEIHLSAASHLGRIRP